MIKEGRKRSKIKRERKRRMIRRGGYEYLIRILIN